MFVNPILQSNVLVTITVIENKNYAPVFDKDEYSFNISENAEIGVTIGSVSATDINQVLISLYNSRLIYHAFLLSNSFSVRNSHP